MHVIVVGGVYASGKTTLCRQLSELSGSEYISASALIQFTPEGADKTAKEVRDVWRNQDAFLEAFGRLKATSSTVLIDGHFVLLDRTGRIVPVPLETFLQLRPQKLILVDATLSSISERLKVRGQTILDNSTLADLIAAERAHAISVSKHLGSPLLIWTNEAGIQTALEFVEETNNQVDDNH